MRDELENVFVRELLDVGDDDGLRRIDCLEEFLPLLDHAPRDSVRRTRCLLFSFVLRFAVLVIRAAGAWIWEVAAGLHTLVFCLLLFFFLFHVVLHRVWGRLRELVEHRRFVVVMSEELGIDDAGALTRVLLLDHVRLAEPALDNDAGEPARLQLPVGTHRRLHPVFDPVANLEVRHLRVVVFGVAFLIVCSRLLVVVVCHVTVHVLVGAQVGERVFSFSE